MTVIKSLLTASAVSVLLAGCGSGSSSDDKTNTDKHVIQIKLINQSTDLIQPQSDYRNAVASQTDNGGYQHLLATDGYDIYVDEGDDGGESYTISHQSFEDDAETIIPLAIVGKATVTVSNPYAVSGQAYYTVASVKQSQCAEGDNRCHTTYAVPVAVSDTPTPVYLANTQWNYVTLPDDPIYYQGGINSELIDAPTINGKNMTKSTTMVDGEHYWFGYASNHTEVHVATNEGFYSIPIAEDDRRNLHKAVTITKNDEGVTVFNPPALDGAGSIKPIEPIQRFVKSPDAVNDEYSCRELGGTHYSFTAFTEWKLSCLIPSTERHALSLREILFDTGYAYRPLPEKPTKKYSSGNKYTADFKWSFSKQDCHNDIIKEMAAYPETYQRAAFSYNGSLYEHPKPCFIEVMDDSLYSEEVAFFSLELLTQELGDIQFFDLNPTDPVDNLGGMSCNNFNASQVSHCQNSERYIGQKIQFDVINNDIRLPLQIFSGTETLSTLNYFGWTDTSSNNKHQDAGIFYEFSILSPDTTTSLHVQVDTAFLYRDQNVYIYNDQSELIERYTTSGSIRDFTQKYRDFTLVRNNENPAYSMALAIKGLKGGSATFYALDFSFHDAM
ncbi:hypothetical protein [Photobacterium nomapromontoriensis]|uniref:hypothetical protein n=1 Tax=Photobacterium nomapromontoriensis TaxID=2910237 RepID=UPI003D0E38D5